MNVSLHQHSHWHGRPVGHHRSRSRLGLALVVVLVAVLGLACSDDGSEQPTGSDEPQPDTVTDVTHTIDPTDQMREAAAQQCLDDVDLATGYVRAVDPTTGNVLSDVEVDCGEVRSGSDG